MGVGPGRVPLVGLYFVVVVGCHGGRSGGQIKQVCSTWDDPRLEACVSSASPDIPERLLPRLGYCWSEEAHRRALAPGDRYVATVVGDGVTTSLDFEVDPVRRLSTCVEYKLGTFDQSFSADVVFEARPVHE